VRSGREQGARLVTGERPVNGSAPSGGYFVRPTLFADVTSDMRIAREEIFGPVMAMASWDDVERVVADANDTSFGLTASIWTSDLDSATHYWGTPFGGMKDTGLGREESIDECESYLEVKAVHVRRRR
jgi:betaine-aldehyde dehydrogenase